MARKKKHPEHVNHERWLVSYADFVTLLFAFFVVMFAVSQVDSKKVGRFTESFVASVDWSIFPDQRSGDGVLQGEGAGTEKGNKSMEKVELDKPTGGGRGVGDFKGHKAAIKARLQAMEIRTPTLSGLKVDEVRGELVLRLPERLIFNAGNADINDQGRMALAAVADELKDRPVRIRIEGHTDGTPIHTARFPSNWELSTARATAVIQYLIETTQLDPERLAAAGYAEHHPIAPNDTADGRAQNRRVDIVVTEVLEPADERTRRKLIESSGIIDANLEGADERDGHGAGTAPAHLGAPREAKQQEPRR